MDNWEKEFRVDDGILEVWERVPPDGDWEGRTASMKEFEEFISKVEAKAHQAGRREVLKEVKDIILPLGIKSKISIDVFRHLSEKLQSLEQKEKG